MGVGCRVEQADLGDSVQSERLGLCYLVIQAQTWAQVLREGVRRGKANHCLVTSC